MADPDRASPMDAEAARREAVFEALGDGLRRLMAVPHLAADPEFRARLNDLATIAAATEDPEPFYAELDALLTYVVSVSTRPEHLDAWRQASLQGDLGFGPRLAILRV